MCSKLEYFVLCRLGILWKNMAKDMKEKYFALAREVDAEHKRKYPGTLYAYSLSSNQYDLVFAFVAARRSLPIRLNVRAPRSIGTR